MKILPYTHVKNHLAEIFDMVRSGEEIVVGEDQGPEKIAIILPYREIEQGKERPVGILKGKATFDLKDGFRMSDTELLDS